MLPRCNSAVLRPLSMTVFLTRCSAGFMPWPDIIAFLIAPHRLPGWGVNFCLAALLLTGCIRASSINPGFTTTPLTATASVPATPLPQPSQASPTPIMPTPAVPELAVTSSLTAENKSVFLAATATEFAGQSRRTLAAFPLQVGNSWVYDYQAYSGDEKASWQVVDTIVETRQSGMLSAFTLQREVSLVQGMPSKEFINTPKAQTYWYILSGNAVYRQETLDWSTVENSGLELVWPFPAQGCWFPDPEQRSNLALPGRPGCRSADGPLTLQLPAGSMDHCYHLMTPYNNGAILLDFCEQVGFVGGKFDHAGTAFGDSFQLTAYSLQNK